MNERRKQMTRDEFDTFCLEVRARGFDSVVTGGGVQRLEQWLPYGAFAGSNPGIEKHMKGFMWLPPNQAVDIPVSDPGPHIGIGVWTFVRTQAGPPLTSTAQEAALAQLKLPRSPADLQAVLEYDSEQEPQLFALQALSARGTQWLEEHPPGGPKPGTVLYPRAGGYFLEATLKDLHVRLL